MRGDDSSVNLFDEKMSDKKKLEMLNRIATVKDDGTVEFQIPATGEEGSIMFAHADTASEVDEEYTEFAENQYIPPLQIVMLIVGTRGDVHPFIAIGKYLQVHHGGAGTTAAGLKAACPTAIVPFFGNQTFWGERVHARGVGPAPIPVDQFSLPRLVEAIKFMVDRQVKERAVELAKAMESEDGVSGAVKAFLKHLPPRTPNPPPAGPPSGFVDRFRKSLCRG